MSPAAPELTDARALEEALAAPLLLLFKHSPVCGVSDRAWSEVEAFLASDEALPCAWLDVVGSQPLSRAVEGRTGVRHESPQALLLARGRVLWHASHGAITCAALAAAARGAQSAAKR